MNPIDYGRYGNPEMIRIFEEDYRHALWLEIEGVVAETQAELGIIPEEAAKDIRKTATSEIVTLQRTMEIESITRHDVAALFEAIAERCKGPGARWVHFGLTSNDVKDTALAMQMKAAFGVLIPQLEKLCKTLAEQAERTNDLLAIGRSHGQHAVPITYGLRFSVWLDEMLRHWERLRAAQQRAAVGKIAGATGSHAALGEIGMELQDRVMSRLGLSSPLATTQIVQRDRHAEVVLSLANLVSSIDKIATDIRALQRTEIGEVFEPFARGKQIGSSAMPHKRNPVTCEKISGLARIVRSFAQPALENVISWEERDISHSSAERFIIPQSFILADYLVREMARVIEGLEIDNQRVNQNLQESAEYTLSEYIMTQLTRAGLDRPKAHEMLRKLVEQSRESEQSLMESIQADSEIGTLFKNAEIDVSQYFKSIQDTSRKIVEKTVRKYKDMIDQR